MALLTNSERPERAAHLTKTGKTGETLRGDKHVEVESKPEGDAVREIPEAWLEELFEFEVCSECGGDVEDHAVCVVPGIGTFFARCLGTGLDDDERGPETRSRGSFYALKASLAEPCGL